MKTKTFFRALFAKAHTVTPLRAEHFAPVIYTVKRDDQVATPGPALFQKFEKSSR